MPDPAQYREVYNEMGGAGAINKGNPLFSEVRAHMVRACARKPRARPDV